MGKDLRPRRGGAEANGSRRLSRQPTGLPTMTGLWAEGWDGGGKQETPEVRRAQHSAWEGAAQ